MRRSLAFGVGVAVAAMAGTAMFALAQSPWYEPPQAAMTQPTAYYPPSYGPQPGTAQPAGYYPGAYPGYYQPRLAMAQPTLAPIPAYNGAPQSPHLPNGAYGPNYGYAPSNGAPAAGPAPPGAPRTPAVYGPPSSVAAGSFDAGCSGCDGGMRCGGRGVGWGYANMPQHYPYYPPMHGYYYFCPYHYTHVPAQQAFASQFGVDPRNPYSNDFFKVVYAEYKASLLRGSPEQIVTPPSTAQGGFESPADVLRKLRALREEGVVSPEEYEAKKVEILGRL